MRSDHVNPLHGSNEKLPILHEILKSTFLAERGFQF